MTPPGPLVTDAASLAAETAEQLVLGSIRDTHLAWLDRVGDTVGRIPGAAPGRITLRRRANSPRRSTLATSSSCGLR